MTLQHFSLNEFAIANGKDFERFGIKLTDLLTAHHYRAFGDGIVTLKVMTISGESGIIFGI